MKMQLLFIVCLLIGLTGSVNAQDKPVKKVTVTGKAVAKSRGTNPNIKTDMPTTDTPVAKPAKSRGDYCTVNFDNYTGLYVKVYVDGNYKGMVSPWSDGDVTVYSGYTTIYCISTGGTREWNASGNCEGSYHYTLQ